VALNTINLNQTFNFILFAMILDQSVPVGYSQYVFGTKVCEGSIFTVKVIIISREAVTQLKQNNSAIFTPVY
jgi:hypothetical protein